MLLDVSVVVLAVAGRDGQHLESMLLRILSTIIPLTMRELDRKQPLRLGNLPNPVELFAPTVL
jgi:hypothetical protein